MFSTIWMKFGMWTANAPALLLLLPCSCIAPGMLLACSKPAPGLLMLYSCPAPVLLLACSWSTPPLLLVLPTPVLQPPSSSTVCNLRRFWHSLILFSFFFTIIFLRPSRCPWPYSFHRLCGSISGPIVVFMYAINVWSQAQISPVDFVVAHAYALAYLAQVLLVKQNEAIRKWF